MKYYFVNFTSLWSDGSPYVDYKEIIETKEFITNKKDLEALITKEFFHLKHRTQVNDMTFLHETSDKSETLEVTLK